MDPKAATVAVAGLLVTLVLLFINSYLAAIVFIIVVVLVMSLVMMQDSMFLPDIAAELRADAKAVVLKNSGNATALRIHAALVPLNIEFDVPSLTEDARYEYPLASMVKEVKVSVTFENEKGGKFERTFLLNALGDTFEPLRPTIPLFRWK